MKTFVPSGQNDLRVETRPVACPACRAEPGADCITKRGGLATLPHVKRLLDEINSRPAAQRAEALKEKHAFKTDKTHAKKTMI